MDSAMRDLEQMRERDDSEGAGRRVALVGLAGATTVGVILALCLQVGTGAADDAEGDGDPLAGLDRASGLHATEPEVTGSDTPGSAPAAEADVDRIGLTFPETLQGDDRPEVAAALAAASAELRHPDPIPGAPFSVPSRAAAGSMLAQEIQERLPAALPAALAAGTGGAIARAAPHDPMLLAALPLEQVGDQASEGHDGDYTVQVISYDSPEGAHAFAAGLRARGHRSFVMRADVDGRGTVYRVRIGPFENMAEATAYRRSFEASERMNTIVVRRR